MPDNDNYFLYTHCNACHAKSIPLDIADFDGFYGSEERSCIGGCPRCEGALYILHTDWFDLENYLESFENYTDDIIDPTPIFVKSFTVYEEEDD